MARSETGKQGTPDETVRRNRTEPLGRSNSFAGQAFARAGFTDPTLVLRWADIVGPDVARVAEPFKLSEGPSGGTLTLRAEPAASLFLLHQTRSLCERINAFLGRPAVAKLRFVSAALADRAEPQRLRRPPKEAPAGDPARDFTGSDQLRTALLDLARARRTND